MEYQLDPKAKIKFVSAEMTNTRLMGVVGMYVHWRAENPDKSTDHIHFFLRYEFELHALTLIAVGEGDTAAAYEIAMKDYFAPLGGDMIGLTERECCWLGNYFADCSLRGGKPVSKDTLMYNFFDSRRTELTNEELDLLFEKMCVPIETDYGLVNYYIMRCMGKDAPAAGFLTDPVSRKNVEPIDLSYPADMLRNSCTKVRRRKDMTTYMCETLAAVEERTFLVLSEVRVRGGRVCYARKNREMELSPLETAFIVGQPEYIRTFSVSGAERTLTERLMEFISVCMVFSHQAGTVYMQIKQDNSHVERPVFRLADDVEVSYFLNKGQDELLITAFGKKALEDAERRLASFLRGGFLEQSGDYLLYEPVFLDFIQTDYEYFADYMADYRDPL